MAKIKVWVLSTCIPDENEPCLPNVFASEAEAMAGFDEYMRAEWQANEPEDEETCEPLPYPGDPVEAHEILSRNPQWGRWEITGHNVETMPPRRTSCEGCAHEPIPGVRLATRGDGSPAIERCDACERFPDDNAAFGEVERILRNGGTQHEAI